MITTSSNFHSTATFTITFLIQKKSRRTSIRTLRKNLRPRSPSFKTQLRSCHTSCSKWQPCTEKTTLTLWTRIANSLRMLRIWEILSNCLRLNSTKREARSFLSRLRLSKRNLWMKLRRLKTQAIKEDTLLLKTSWSRLMVMITRFRIT